VCRICRPVALLVPLLVLLLGGCVASGDATRPIPTAFVPAPRAAHRLVVMLPGRGDDLASLERRGIAPIIQSAWPDADVVLTGLTMPYYKQGEATRRLHDEVIDPARRRNDREVWIVGISLGGMGALLYDRDYPAEVDGMLLMSPYLGEHKIHQEIRDAGGLAQWTPDPAQPIGPATFQRELWRSLKHWSDDASRTRSVWLAYGDSEPFRAPIELISPLLPPDHVLMLQGHHNWALWTPALNALLRSASAGATTP
jgi:pimeloyl-ACP methyl ester carboxylesterase